MRTMVYNYYEIMGDYYDELADWDAYEADMAEGDPWAEG